MKLFDCKVRLAGDVANEVLKRGISDAEITLLRAIHGNDAVVDVVDTKLDALRHEVVRDVNVSLLDAERNKPIPVVDGEVERTSAQERERLAFLYGERIVADVFGGVLARIGDEPPPLRLPPRSRASPKASTPALGDATGMY